MSRIVLAITLLGFTTWAYAVLEKVTPEMAEEKGCLSCHEGIEEFTEGRMWDDILEQGASHNDENGCVICHGGNSLGTTMQVAHKGSPASLVEKGAPKLFLPDPGAVGVNEQSCGQCHSGYGIENGRFMQGYEKDLIVELTHAMGNVIPSKATVQSPAIPKLDHDLSQIVTRDGKQLVSVGSHWPLMGPLPQEMREKMERTGVCMGCH
jgi:hypothetical protein